MNIKLLGYALNFTILGLLSKFFIVSMNVVIPIYREVHKLDFDKRTNYMNGSLGHIATMFFMLAVILLAGSFFPTFKMIWSNLKHAAD
ncbi:hypothetical protein EQG49_04070 [Periweissella cryptocerci]|uniref:Uncharacterized protein n=1 Tax=Periweissella cryptocerci TaxID=2506420 RepID=A0A4P6YSK8_9LACO|nr:hypothetical protein [Periweissella cryptocerci]QBO35694.1 hypothetical protein EQG49_04070 [Periweissella cryptocerci]